MTKHLNSKILLIHYLDAQVEVCQNILPEWEFAGRQALVSEP